MTTEGAKGVLIRGLVYCDIKWTVHMAMEGGRVNIPRSGIQRGIKVGVGGEHYKQLLSPLWGQQDDREWQTAVKGLLRVRERWPLKE